MTQSFTALVALNRSCFNERCTDGVKKRKSSVFCFMSLLQGSRGIRAAMTMVTMLGESCCLYAVPGMSHTLTHTVLTATLQVTLLIRAGGHRSLGDSNAVLRNTVSAGGEISASCVASRVPRAYRSSGSDPPPLLLMLGALHVTRLFTHAPHLHEERGLGQMLSAPSRCLVSRQNKWGK